LVKAGWLRQIKEIGIKQDKKEKQGKEQR